MSTGFATPFFSFAGVRWTAPPAAGIPHRLCIPGVVQDMGVPLVSICCSAPSVRGEDQGAGGIAAATALNARFALSTSIQRRSESNGTLQ